MNKEKLTISALPIMIGIATSLIYLAVVSPSEVEGGFGMDTAGVIAIVVALIGVAGGIWAQVVQFKRDSGKVDGVKSDTDEMKPRIRRIDDCTQEMKDDVVKRLVPGLTTNQKIADGMERLVEEMIRQQTIRTNTPDSKMDRTLAEISKVYEDRSKLHAQIQELQMENDKLMVEISGLKEEIRLIKKQEIRPNRSDRGMHR